MNKSSELSSQNYVIFGGTFDPIHEGHVSALRLLLAEFSSVIIAPTSQNPWKSSPPAQLDLRREMIEIALQAESLPLCSHAGEKGIFISDYAYVYAADLVAYYRSQLSGCLHWAVSEDQQDSFLEWKDWAKLEVPMRVLPISIFVHAADIRSGKSAPHPALADYISQKQLYLS